jgi:hypothetical protein
MEQQVLQQLAQREHWPLPAIILPPKLFSQLASFLWARPS